MSLKFLCFIAAAVCFAFSFFGKPAVNVSWRDGGYFFITVGLFII